MSWGGHRDRGVGPAAWLSRGGSVKGPLASAPAGVWGRPGRAGKGGELCGGGRPRGRQQGCKVAPGGRLGIQGRLGREGRAPRGGQRVSGVAHRGCGGGLEARRAWGPSRTPTLQWFPVRAPQNIHLEQSPTRSRLGEPKGRKPQEERSIHPKVPEQRAYRAEPLTLLLLLPDGLPPLGALVVR